VSTLFDQYCRTAKQPPKPQAIALGIVSDCDLQRHQLKQMLTRQGYDVKVNCRPEHLESALPKDANLVRLWLLDPQDQDDDASWARVAERINATTLFGIGRPPLERAGQTTEANKQWERRLLNKIEISLYGRVVSRSNEYIHVQSQV
jgi:hypothetical protein